MLVALGKYNKMEPITIKKAKLLMKKYWPGPLSLVFPANIDKVCPLIRANQTTVAIRAPQHPLTQALLEKFGRPLVAPSANPFEKLSPTTAEHVLKHFPKQDLAILDGGRCQLGIESTIIDMAIQPGRILRPGQLKLGNPSPKTTDIRVPGQYLRHYQPQKPCYYFEEDKDLPENAYIMCFSPLSNVQVNYQFPEHMAGIYYEFYYQLQRADETPATCILIELPKPEARYAVIRERIMKAAQKLN
jgi:L-threonylcarbamoyladenylate synthase